MRKPTICIGDNKSAVTMKLISALVFATRIAHFFYFLNQKFRASSHLLCLYSSICVGSVWKPYCLISYDAANIFVILFPRGEGWVRCRMIKQEVLGFKPACAVLYP